MKSKIWVVALVVAAFAGGVLFAANTHLEAGSVTVFLNQDGSAPKAVDFSPLWKTWQLINDHYVATASSSASSTSLTDQEKVWGAVRGLVDSLNDPYSNFMTPDENKMFEQEISGNFGGVGMEVGMRDKVITVISALPDTPAKRAGIESGDQIVEINSQPTAKMSVTEAINLIRGEVGTKVTLSIARAKVNQLITFNLTRATIAVPTIETDRLPGGITQIKLFNFGATASDLFAKAIRDFAQSSNQKLILDLRGNPGGYLDAAVNISSWFLPKGAPVVIEDRGKGAPQQIYRSAGYPLFSKVPKLVVLVDGGSASASEIVAGALKENGVAKLVGEQTFGKGSVQELFSVSKDTSLKLTIAKWLTPHGVSISQNGLKPDILAKHLEATSTKELTLDNDPQLQAAVKALR